MSSYLLQILPFSEPEASWQREDFGLKLMATSRIPRCGNWREISVKALHIPNAIRKRASALLDENGFSA